MNTFELEKKMQPFMNDYYESQGKTFDRSQACKRFDVIVNGSKVEEKYLLSEKYSCFLVEIVQQAKPPKLDWGWFYHCEADYLAWIHCSQKQPIEVLFIEYKILQDHIFSMFEKNKWIQVNLCPINYGLTINIPVQWNSIKHTSHKFEKAGNE